MIKNYLEIIEQLSEQESLEKQQQLIRIEVKDEIEAKKKLAEFEPAFAGLNYVKRMLTQRHWVDADKNQPCVVKKL